jgi:hypothetical protein
MKGVSRIIFAILILTLAAPARADERIPFERGGLKGNDWAFFKDYLKANYPLIIKYVAEIRGLSPEAAWEPLRRYVPYSGRYDINGDGVEELFVTIQQSFVCGTVGCETPIFQMTPDGWRELSSITVRVSIRGGPRLSVSDEVIDGYRTLLADYYGLHWNGEQYIGYCRRDCTRG